MNKGTSNTERDVPSKPEKNGAKLMATTYDS